MTPFEAFGAGIAGIAGFIAAAVWYAPFTFGPLWLRFAPDALGRLEHTLARRLSHYLIALVASRDLHAERYCYICGFVGCWRLCAFRHL